MVGRLGWGFDLLWVKCGGTVMAIVWNDDVKRRVVRYLWILSGVASGHNAAKVFLLQLI